MARPKTKDIQAVTAKLLEAAQCLEIAREQSEKASAARTNAGQPPALQEALASTTNAILALQDVKLQLEAALTARGASDKLDIAMDLEIAMASGGVQLTKAERKTVQAIKAEPGIYGRQISDANDIPHGTVYLVLQRLEKWGWLRSKKEAGGQGPKRRRYWLTREGQKQVTA